MFYGPLRAMCSASLSQTMKLVPLLLFTVVFPIDSSQDAAEEVKSTLLLELNFGVFIIFLAFLPSRDN